MTNTKTAALVTGGAQRIGHGIVLALAEMGFDIALHYNHSRAQAAKIADEIRNMGVTCEIFPCDLANETETAKLITQVKKKFPRFNLLVNNASIFEKSTFDVKQLKLFQNHFNINLKAPFILSSEFKRICRRGQIINILDTDITKNKTTHVAYLLTKKTLADLTQMAALDFAPDIRVNGIAPGLILPPKGATEKYLEQRAQKVPLKRKGNVNYIAQSVKFLIQNDYLTGQFLFNDGGEHLHG